MRHKLEHFAMCLASCILVHIAMEVVAHVFNIHH